MGYYDYTDEFRSLITNTNTIIDNQEELMTNFNTYLNFVYIIVFMLVLFFTLSIVRKVFRTR